MMFRNGRVGLVRYGGKRSDTGYVCLMLVFLVSTRRALLEIRCAMHEIKICAFMLHQSSCVLSASRAL
jgi:hypothetical protein